MTVAPLAPGIEPLARALLLAFATEHRRIQVERAARLGTGRQAQEPAPERPPERLDVRLGKAEEEITNRVIAGETFQAEHRVQHAVGAQPVAVGEAPCADHHRQEEGGERVGWRDGVVGSGFGEGHPALHLRGEADLAQEGDETGQAAEGRDGLGRFIENELGLAKEGGISVRVVLCGVGSGCFSINPYAHSPLLKTTLFSTSAFGVKAAIQFNHVRCGCIGLFDFNDGIEQFAVALSARVLSNAIDSTPTSGLTRSSLFAPCERMSKCWAATAEAVKASVSSQWSSGFIVF